MRKAGPQTLHRHVGDVRAAPRPYQPDAICNYAADAGAGSQIITNIAESPGWRGALLGTVAAGSLWLYSARVARAGPDGCTITGTSPNQIATCQGNQSQGITSAGAGDFDPADVETLNVNNLTTDITPAAGLRRRQRRHHQ
jgi:hypothetical protein